MVIKVKVISAVVLALLLAINPSCCGGRVRYEAVQGCNLLLHPYKYNGHIIRVSGTYTIGMEREALTFSCPGSLDVSLSLSKNDLKKYGFLTSKDSIAIMDRNMRDVSTKGILTGEINATARVSILGLYRCHYDFPNCEGATRSSGSIVIKTIRFESPVRVHQLYK
jgi:hypothetical protein